MANYETIERSIMVITLMTAVVAFYKLYDWNKSYRAWRTAHNKYKLYAIRDRMIFLVASGTLREDGWIFSTFYPGINSIVCHQHEFTFSKILSGMRDQARIARNKEFFTKLEAQLELHNDPETKRLISDFYFSMFQIVIENSLTLRTAIRLGRIGVHIIDAWKRVWMSISKHQWARRILPNHLDAYEVYASSEKIINDLGLAAS